MLITDFKLKNDMNLLNNITQHFLQTQIYYELMFYLFINQ